MNAHSVDMDFGPAHDPCTIPACAASLVAWVEDMHECKSRLFEAADSSAMAALASLMKELRDGPGQGGEAMDMTQAMETMPAEAYAVSPVIPQTRVRSDQEAHLDHVDAMFMRMSVAIFTYLRHVAAEIRVRLERVRQIREGHHHV